VHPVPYVSDGAEFAHPTAEELEAAQQQATAHADDPGTGMCPQCGATRCETWREADAVILRGLDGMAAETAGDDVAGA
jgi:hypothetical protein